MKMKQSSFLNKMKLKKKKEKRLLSDYNKYIIIFLNLEFVKKTLYILEK